MENLPYIVGICFSVLLIYKLASLLYFFFLKAKLRNGNLNTFTRIIGENYQHRPQFNGLIRYKWSKGWVNVKANFDEDGRLIFTKIQTRIFRSLKSELLFIAKI